MNSTLRGIEAGVLAVVAPLTAVSGQSQPAHGNFVTSDGIRIHHLTAGQGSAVVLVHGHGGDAQSSWVSTGVVGALASRYRVIAIDLRGHGQSEKPGWIAKLPQDEDARAEQRERNIRMRQKQGAGFARSQTATRRR